MRKDSAALTVTVSAISIHIVRCRKSPAKFTLVLLFCGRFDKTDGGRWGKDNGRIRPGRRTRLLPRAGFYIIVYGIYIRYLPYAAIVLDL